MLGKEVDWHNSCTIFLCASFDVENVLFFIVYVVHVLGTSLAKHHAELRLINVCLIWC